MTARAAKVWTLSAHDTLATTAISMVAEPSDHESGGRVDPTRLDSRPCRRGDVVAVDPLDGPDPLVYAATLVDRLPERQRAVLVLRYFEGLSEAEIAETLSCRPGTVKSLASRALDRLRKELDA